MGINATSLLWVLKWRSLKTHATQEKKGEPWTKWNSSRFIHVFVLNQTVRLKRFQTCYYRYSTCPSCHCDWVAIISLPPLLVVTLGIVVGLNYNVNIVQLSTRDFSPWLPFFGYWFIGFNIMRRPCYYCNNNVIDISLNNSSQQLSFLTRAKMFKTAIIDWLMYIKCSRIKSDLGRIIQLHFMISGTRPHRDSWWGRVVTFCCSPVLVALTRFVITC